MRDLIVHYCRTVSVFSPGWHESKVDSVGTRQSDGAHWGTHCPNTDCLETCKVKEQLSVSLIIYVPYFSVCVRSCNLRKVTWSYFYSISVIPCNLNSKDTHRTHNKTAALGCLAGRLHLQDFWWCFLSWSKVLLWSASCSQVDHDLLCQSCPLSTYFQ